MLGAQKILGKSAAPLPWEILILGVQKNLRICCTPTVGGLKPRGESWGIPPAAALHTR